ncbi:MAG: acylphosphatase [Deltaproteobacteria bacterium]|nr:acylphosphatase [Deltaproteobacteria bacterium]MBW2649305.1 acylphosphatase [Deltaproteobacteria bacterium]
MVKSCRDSNDNQSEQGSCESATRRVHVFITGRVQGVFFRAETKKQALESGLAGWVKNLDDNRVEAIFEGSENDVEKMIDWCKKGPRFAHVREVKIVEESRPVGTRFEDFEIRY